jgi:hypothetical protein
LGAGLSSTVNDSTVGNFKKKQLETLLKLMTRLFSKISHTIRNFSLTNWQVTFS